MIDEGYFQWHDVEDAKLMKLATFLSGLSSYSWLY
jgi:hypothetical protein